LHFADRLHLTSYSVPSSHLPGRVPVACGLRADLPCRTHGFSVSCWRTTRRATFVYHYAPAAGCLPEHRPACEDFYLPLWLKDAAAGSCLPRGGDAQRTVLARPPGARRAASRTRAFVLRMPRAAYALTILFCRMRYGRSAVCRCASAGAFVICASGHTFGFCRERLRLNVGMVAPLPDAWPRATFLCGRVVLSRQRLSRGHGLSTQRAARRSSLCLHCLPFFRAALHGGSG